MAIIHYRYLNFRNKFCVASFVFVLLMSNCFSSLASAISPDSTLKQGFIIPNYFEMNTGQLDSEIFYAYHTKSCNILFGQDHIFYQFIKREKSDSCKTGMNFFNHVCNIELTFESKNPNVVPNGKGQLDFKSNRFVGNDKSRWASDIPNYQTLEYSNIYNGIDVKYFSNRNSIKYDVIIHPGGDYNDISISYNGARNLAVNEKGQLEITTDSGVICENIPSAFQMINGEKKYLEVTYRLIKPCTVGFNLNTQPVYGADIIIDPNLIYSTFVGGFLDDYCDVGDLKKDKSGNVYVCGTTSSNNFPVTPGSYDINNNGNSDCVVFKLSPNLSTLMYSTYFGGMYEDFAYDIDIDTTNNCAFIVGTTESSDFPTTPGAFDLSFGGGTYDAFVVKLSANGNSLLYSSYLGGPSNDQGCCVTVDSLGNAYCSGQTSGSFPTTAGVVQPFFGGGGWDCYIAKINNTGSAVLFSTYLGGTQDDRGAGLAVDRDLNVFFHGIAENGFPTTSSSFQPVYGGGANDSYVGKLNSTGSALYYCSYLGGPENDYERAGLQVDKIGQLYVTGLCQNGFPTTPNAFDQSFNGNYDVYVTKINAAGTALVYSTYLGGPNSDAGYDIQLMGNGRVLVTGACGDGFPVTPCAWNETYNNGTTDAFLSMISENGDSLIYSTYLGGINNERGFGVVVSSDTVCIAGFTDSPDFPTTPGSYNPLWSGASDFFVTKLKLLSSSFDLVADSIICSGESAVLSAYGGNSYIWSTGSVSPSITVFPSITTNYTVTITNSGCSDVQSATVLVKPTPSLNLGNDTTYCTEIPIILSGGGSGNTYLWQDNTTLSSYTITNTGTYSVTATNSSGCSSTDSIQIIITQSPNHLDLGNDSAVCDLSSLVLNADNGFISYIWQDGSTGQYYYPVQSGSYSVTVTDSMQCILRDTIDLLEKTPPVAQLGPDQFLCEGQQIVLQVECPENNCIYFWNDSTFESIHIIEDTGIYSVTITNECGSSTDSIKISDCPLCFADLPTAFTPNSDGINDKARILGSGFSGGTLMIYNRHGERVFETNDLVIGWDGLFNGVLQENEVYFYYFQVTCINGDVLTKKGDITLIR